MSKTALSIQKSGKAGKHHRQTGILACAADGEGIGVFIAVVIDDGDHGRPGTGGRRIDPKADFEMVQQKIAETYCSHIPDSKLESCPGADDTNPSS